MSEEEETQALVEVRTKRSVLAWDEVFQMVADLPQHSKTSFLVIGHRSGVRLAVPKTVTGVSRVYFYGNGDYSLVPATPGITVFSPEDRKAQRRGGIMAEVDFERGLVEARAALEALVEAVRRAPPPAPRGLKKAKAPRAPNEVDPPLGGEG